MKHTYRIEGLSYRLRPVTIDDAELILKIRLEDTERTKYMHEIVNDVEVEKQWLELYFQREGDYFFVVENKFSGESEGLISLYNEKDEKAEWGRWTIKKGSMAAVESVFLIYEFAFFTRKLKEVYCRTIVDNKDVVSFHETTGLLTRGILEEYAILRENKYDAVEQYLSIDIFKSHIKEQLYSKCYMLFVRNLRLYVGKMEFHHIGIASNKIEREKMAFQMLGYKFENQVFEDKQQKVRGIFGTAKGQPCIEILENMEDSDTLTPYLSKGQKMYHYGYYVEDIEKVAMYLEQGRAKLMSPMKESTYFGKRICFYMLSNMFLVELIER